MLRYVFTGLGILLSLLINAQYLPNVYSSLPTTHNFVRSYTVLKPGLSSTDIINEIRLPTEVQLTSQYLDGLGRPLQSVVRKGSLNTAVAGSTPKDLVQLHTYDEFGREVYQFLPYAHNVSSDGQFKGTAISDPSGIYKSNPTYSPFAQQRDFYKASNALSPIAPDQNETYFYSKTNFEPSPLNRVTEQYAPGNSWVGTSANLNPSDRRSVKSGYFFNTALDSVRIWNVNDNATLGVFKTYASPTGTAGIYPAGQLFKTITTDEHGKQVIEFKDKQGQVILKKVQIHNVTDGGLGADHNPLHWICTYYIYDDFGSLRCVVQPEGVKWLHFNSWNLSNATILAEQCFRYEYDERRRMSMKKVPGAEPVYMVYDKRDRLVLTQDGNMRGQNNWLYTWYDELNRPVASGLWTTTDIFSTQIINAAVQPRTTYQYYPLSGTAGLDELTTTYYDNYNWRTGTPLSGGFSQAEANRLPGNATNNNTSYPYARQIATTTAVKGMPTGGRTKVLGTTTWLYTATYYDADGRPIQMQSTNLTGGVDVATTQYGFAGQPGAMAQRQQVVVAAGNTQTTVTLTTFTFDALGRVESTGKTIQNSAVNGNATANKTINIVKYDAMGQVKTKALGTKPGTNTNPITPLETLNMDYNIRGWLLGINRGFVNIVSALDPPDAGKWFGFNIGYVDPNYTAQQYNGNISGQTWRSAGDRVQRRYHYSYDAANRLWKADFEQRSSTLSTWQKTFKYDCYMGDGTDPQSAYDLNGNIKRMQQWGWTVASPTAKIDDLTYSYALGSTSTQTISNKLQAVNDAITAATGLGDFTNKNTTTTDYSYDVNGNMTVDLNKAISTIAYNHLNLPSNITVTAKGTIAYTYDAAGSKLKKTVTEGTVVTSTFYLGGSVYEQKGTAALALQFVAHEEGRFRPLTTAAGWAADYMLKDHLGNVRMVLTDEVKSDLYQALSFEGAANSPEITNQNNTWETATGQRYDVINRRTTQANLQNYPGTPPPLTNSLLVRSSTGKVGAAKLLKVMAGDKIHTTVQYYYPPAGINPAGTGLNTLTAGLAAAIASSLAPVAAIKNGATILASGVGADPAAASFFTSQNNNSAPTRPKAYLNVLFFDDQFKFDASSSYSEQIGSTNPGQIFVALNPGAKLARKSGYCYIYISNESNDLVYFDNLTLTHERGPLLEETHYYPFGLTMAGISSKAAGKLENKYKFNEGTELTNDFDISLYETPHRSYDPQIGRFLQIDEFGEVLEEWSSYVFALNNPISFNDPEGLYPDDPLPKEVPKDAPAPTLPNVTVVALRKTGDVFHGFNRYYSMLAKTDGDLSRIVNDQFRNEMYRYQELAQFRNRVNEMTRATDEVALEIGSNFIPMGWLVKIGKLRYLQKVYLLKRGKAITTVGKGTNLVDDGANVAVNAVENAAKGVSVIGPRSTYREFAKKIGANFLDVTDEAWTMRKNVEFLQGVVKRGDDVIFSGKFNPAKLDPKSVLGQEIRYLQRHGYSWTDDFSRMIKK